MTIYTQIEKIEKQLKAMHEDLVLILKKLEEQK